ncbi:MAG TPA: transglycosylase SLT domain-containing protein [Burkholderiales bacterium]|nr:transglycosylase SLT domain-containing protein [Burkholderiales bacterium]
MQSNVATLAMAAVGAALIAGSGEALAPDAAPAGCTAMEDDPAAAPLAFAAEHQALVGYLSRRFTIATEATEQIVEAAHRAADEVGLDPLLVLAVIAVESRFNPIAQSSMGAKGLMQIIPKYHRAKLDRHGGEQAVLDPESNIFVGARILQEYVHRTGSLEAGLQFYNGAFWDGSAQYAQRVMAERRRLEAALRAERNA